MQLDDVLVDLKLQPHVLDLPAPRYFVTDRIRVSSSRDGCGVDNHALLVAPATTSGASGQPRADDALTTAPQRLGLR